MFSAAPSRATPTKTPPVAAGCDAAARTAAMSKSPSARAPLTTQRSAAPCGSSAPLADSREELCAHADPYRNYIGAIERGEINPIFRVLLKLERGLNMPPSELIATNEELHYGSRASGWRRTVEL